MSPETMPDQVEVTQEDAATAEEIVSAANIVSHDGYYEADLEAVALVVARHRQAAVQKARADALEEAAKLVKRRAEEAQAAGMEEAMSEANCIWLAIRSLTERELTCSPS